MPQLKHISSSFTLNYTDAATCGDLNSTFDKQNFTCISPTTKSATASSSSSSSPSTIDPQPVISSDSDSSSELSTGAKAGVGVGVALGALSIGSIAGFFLLRRRKNRGAASASINTFEVSQIYTDEDSRSGPTPERQ